MISFPNAKINLGLHIVSKRSDGYHNLETCFYPVNWTDVLEIIETTKETVFSSSGIKIEDSVQNNLCMKAYITLQKSYKLPPVHIHLHKTIPTQAGLGGGSSNAAFTIKLLNDKFSLQLSDKEMEKLVQPLGADCAFFIRNNPVFASGKGDVFEQTRINLKGKWILLIFPNIPVSTKEAFSGLVYTSASENLREVLKSSPENWKDHLKNQFEAHLFEKYPVLKNLKDTLYQKGATYASLSGSGSTIYGIFETEPEIASLQKAGFLSRKTLLN